LTGWKRGTSICKSVNNPNLLDIKSIFLFF
jgi:hypothetical protein